MGFSKRKPYTKEKDKPGRDGRSWGLRTSVLEFFRQPVRYLKESNQKESQFEKPYRSGDYPKMHLRIPTPDWPSARRSPVYPAVDGGGTRSRIHTIIFADPSCHTGVAKIGCGDSDSLYFSIWSTPPSELGGSWHWQVYKAGATVASLLDDVEMSEPLVSGERGDKVTVILSAPEGAEDGTITICARADWSGGTSPTKSITVDVPEGANPFFIGSQALGRPYQRAPIRPSNLLSRLARTLISCCQDVVVEGCCSDGVVTAYDYINSAQEIAESDDAAVFVTGSGDDLAWSVEGTGFWLNQAFSTKTLGSGGTSVTVYTDASACGPGTFTVTDCDSNSVQGEIRCTHESGWVQDGTFIPHVCGAYTSKTGAGHHLIQGKYYVYHTYIYSEFMSGCAAKDCAPHCNDSGCGEGCDDPCVEMKCSDYDEISGTFPKCCNPDNDIGHCYCMGYKESNEWKCT